jgi:hypothetical protein
MIEARSIPGAAPIFSDAKRRRVVAWLCWDHIFICSEGERLFVPPPS